MIAMIAQHARRQDDEQIGVVAAQGNREKAIGGECR